MQGILAPEDARLAVEQGVDGIIVSNHGGRQLDGSPAALDVRVWVCVRMCWGERVGGVGLGSSVLPVLPVLQHEYLCTGKGGGTHDLGGN